MRKNGRGRGRMPTAQEQQLMKQLSMQRVAPQAQAIGRDVNKSEARPAFEQHPPLDYSEYRKEMLRQAKADKLPDMKVFDPNLSRNLQPETVSMASYPRSGNTLLRTWVERITGIFSGSDGSNQGALHQALKDIGLEGEGVADKRVQLVKTHFPERSGSIFYSTQKTILLLRSPLDCIISLFHMDCTGTHDCSILDSDFIAYQNQWEEWIKNEITIWRDFHSYWLKQDIPLHIIRYEDLVARPGEVLPSLMKFVFNTKDISDTLLQSYIDLAVNEGAQKTYKPRVGKANVNMDKYSQKMLDLIVKESEQQLKDFGFYYLFNQSDSQQYECDGQIEWIKQFNQTQLDTMLKGLRMNLDKLAFIVVNHKDQMLREKEHDPINYPYGRGFQRISRYMMPRATKIGKTLIEMSIKTGDRIVVGKKDNKVHVDLDNPTEQMLEDCQVDEETKKKMEEQAKLILLDQQEEENKSQQEEEQKIKDEQRDKMITELEEKTQKSKETQSKKRDKEDRETLAFIEDVFEQGAENLDDLEQYEQELRAIEAVQSFEQKFK